ncbi:iron-dependent extradiol dioxygenase [Gordonia spumicola]|uniref:Iron-dependent extradiol dioxygenase n=1 Tax=Gordonia spumicola TaxID=589161 RepID=A0A7I9V5X8_9ACTN|nr:VOC family protein [Gordonia spumicola]GEE00483.1 iron-dependent extradiol dioxygenase [Gordonia spumicola]
MIQELSYVGFASPAVDEWRTYGPGLLGAMLAPDGPDGSVRLAVDDIDHRISIHPGPEDEFRYAGWGLANETDLHEFVDALVDRGIAPTWADLDLCRERGVAELAWFTDPWGLRHELTWGKAATPYSFRAGRAMRGGFVTGDQGLGHVVFQVPDLVAANRFYADALGFRLSDRIVSDHFDVRFYHVNGRHHSLALAEAPGHVGFNHLMLEYQSMDDLGKAIDLLRAFDVPTMQTLGRHSNDLMTSTYIGTPSGFQIELGYGGLVVDDLSWTARTYAEPSFWGHRFTRTAMTTRPGILRPVG